MKPINFASATHRFGAPRDWDAEKDGECQVLPVQMSDGVCASVWQPTPAEIEMLAKGARIVLHVWGGQPPVMLVTEFVDAKDE